MRGTTRCALAMGLALAAAMPTWAQTLELKLDGSLEGRAGGRTLKAALGPGARFVKSAEGQGVEPGPQGPAVIVPVPDALWRSSGALAFRLRVSRDVRYRRDYLAKRVVRRPGDTLARRMLKGMSPEAVRAMARKARPISATLVKCPLFTLKLGEYGNSLILWANMASGAKPKNKAGRREVAWATRGRLYWSHLKGGPWYHVVFTWDAAKGRMDAILNGSIQQEMRLRRRWKPWTPPARPSGALEIGGSFGAGADRATLAVDSIQLYPAFMTEAQAAATLKGRPNFALQGEGHWDLPGSLDLSPYNLRMVYADTFDKPLNFIPESKLFAPGGMYKPPDPKATGRRAKRPRHHNQRIAAPPPGVDWVLEGGGKAWTEKGRCHVKSDRHQVLWNTREFPRNFMIEFGIAPGDSKVGLTIIFFATRNVRGGAPWERWMQSRDGDFRTYHSGELNGYHLSYWACNPFDGGILRRTTNLRKNSAFLMPCAGTDRIGGMGPGPHRVRLLKVGPKIRLETNGRLSLAFDDDGKTYGPVWDRPGWIGLRQMGHSRHVAYTDFKVWEVTKK